MSLELHIRYRFHPVAGELIDGEAVPDHIAAHHQVLAHGEPCVDVGLAVLVVSVIKVECQAHTDPADDHDVLLHSSVSRVFYVVSDQGHREERRQDEHGEGGGVKEKDF